MECTCQISPTLRLRLSLALRVSVSVDLVTKKAPKYWGPKKKKNAKLVERLGWQPSNIL